MIEFIHGADDTGSGFVAHLGSEADTNTAGAALASALAPGLVIYLVGDLGTGKTTLARGVLEGLGHTGKVKSPTYTLIEPYVVSSLHLYHFDFYRFAVPEEYLEAGLDEYFAQNGVCLVEWPDKARPYLAAADLEISLAVSSGGRQIKVSPRTEAGRSCAQKTLTVLKQHPA